jgi:argonaute-like protein implicated in RNA metabolism and viral defense
MNLLDDQNSIDRLLNAGLALGTAERELKEAVRVDRQDEEIRRNLELVGKRQRAVLAAIKQLFNAAGALPPAQRDAIIDVLNMKMPEEFKKEDKGKDNTRYMIMEKF